MLQRPYHRLSLLLIALLASACAGTRGNVYPLDEAYLRSERMFARLQEIMDLNPALVRLNIIGFSSNENLPIYCLDIGRPHATSNVLLIGQHHGDEVLGLEVVLDWAEKLASKSREDKKTDAILDVYRFWIVPTLNPEGHRVVSAGLSSSKRKNNRDTNANGKLDLHEDGVDLNRNYPVFWEAFDSPPPHHQNYKGPEPASEKEILAIIQLAQKQSFDYAIFYHSSPSGALSEKIFLPALDRENARQVKAYEEVEDFARAYARLLPKDYLRGRYEVSPAPGTRMGTARNYFFHMHGTKAFLVEIGGVNTSGISIIHPGKAIRDKIVAKHLKALTKVFYAML